MAINNQVARQETAHLDDRIFEIERKKTKTIVHLYKVVASCDFREYWEGQEEEENSLSEKHGVYTKQIVADRKREDVVNLFLARGYTRQGMTPKQHREKFSSDSTDAVIYVERIKASPEEIFWNGKDQYRYEGYDVVL